MTDIRVDQAFFGWSPEEQQLTILANSFGKNELAQYWLHQLQAHVRLQPVPGTALPADAFSYFRYEDRAAVLRRVGMGASAGRNNSHALIASASRLTPAVAIDLSCWPGWQATAPTSSFMQPLSFDSVKNTSRTAESFREQVARCEEAIAVILARFLEDPSRPLSIVGCRDEDRLTVVWAIRELAENYLQPRLHPLPDWSFSTYEDRHDVTVEGLPWIIFLPAKPQGPGVVDRVMIDLEHPDMHSDDLGRARRLVRDLREGEPPRQTVAAHPPDPTGNHQSRMRSGDRPGVSTPAKSLSAGARDAVAVLHEARSLREFVRQLQYLEHHALPSIRPTLREVLDVPAMDKAARFIEVDCRQELLGLLLTVAYGPGLADLDDARAEKHAAKLLQETRSDQLALMIGANGQLERDRIRTAVLRRWSAERSEPSERGGRMLRRLRASQMSRYLPWVTLAAVLAILGLAFLGGYLAGSPGQ